MRPLLQGILAADLTLAEVKTLFAIQRLPAIRDPNFDGKYRVITLQEHIDLVKVSRGWPASCGQTSNQGMRLHVVTGAI